MNQYTELLRQVHPHHFKDGLPSSQAFYPTPSDKGLLSVYDGDMISPRDSFKHYTEVIGSQSAGVWSVTVEEVNLVGLSARPDPEPFPEHALIDYSSKLEKEWRKYAKLLVEYAKERGCRHHPV